MRRRTPSPPPPLPQRDGVDPVRVRLPTGDAWATVRDHLVARLSAGAGVIDAMLDAGLIVDVTGRPVPRDMVYVPGMSVWFHRELPAEERVPFAIDVLYRDEHVVVADKPHFLATTPAAAMSPKRPWPGCAGSWASRRSAPRTGWTGSPPGCCCSPCGPANAARTSRCSGTGG